MEYLVRPRTVAAFSLSDDTVPLLRTGTTVTYSVEPYPHQPVTTWTSGNPFDSSKSPDIPSRGVHDTGIPMGPMGPMGIPWEWEA